MWFLDSLPFFVAAITVLAVTRPIAAAARRLGIVDVPGGRKGHDAVTPLLGGAVVLCGLGAGVVSAILLGEPDLGHIGSLLAGALAAWSVGTYDDWRGVRARSKAALQATIAIAWLWWIGADGVMFVVGVGFLVFAMNGMNLLDNTDGLCTVAALPPFAGLAVLSLSGVQALVRGDETAISEVARFEALSLPAFVVTLSIGGALIGFLPHNLPRARIFLGDGGSLVIGFLLGALVYDLTVVAYGWPALPAAICFLALPVADTATVVVTRLREGRPVWVGDRRHLSHRLHARGWSERGALAALGVLSAAGTALGLWAVWPA